MEKKNDIVIAAELDWDGLHCQSHVVALGYAKAGHKVYYINRTLQRWPTLNHLMRRLKPRRSYGSVSSYANTPNVEVVTLWVGPPISWLRPLNRILINRKLKNYKFNDPYFIAYIPSYNSLDIREEIKPVRSAYICYHNFDADNVLPDLVKAEKEFILTSDVLFADAAFLQKRLERIGKREVFRSMPGVYYDLFAKAFRGDEIQRRKNIYFFGGVGPHMNIELYNKLSDKYSVTFIGVVDDRVKEILNPKINVIDPVSNLQLPELLKDADMLSILYLNTDYIKGVIPAKFFECLATGKPVLVSGLDEARPYHDVVYDVEDSFEKAVKVIEGLQETETKERREKQKQVAMDADWKSRFDWFAKCMSGKS